MEVRITTRRHSSRETLFFYSHLIVIKNRERRSISRGKMPFQLSGVWPDHNITSRRDSLFLINRKERRRKPAGGCFVSNSARDKDHHHKKKNDEISFRQGKISFRLSWKSIRTGMLLLLLSTRPKGTIFYPKKKTFIVVRFFFS